MILYISVFQVARITGVSHGHMTIAVYFEEVYLVEFLIVWILLMVFI
jgi:hypothetical protein